LHFMGFSFKTSKSKNDINYIKYQFSHTFGKVCKWLNMYYSHIKILIFLKVTTMSIWIILKILYGFIGSVFSANFELLYLACTLLWNYHLLMFTILVQSITWFNHKIKS
jgi:hypothetical protein